MILVALAAQAFLYPGKEAPSWARPIWIASVYAQASMIATWLVLRDVGFVSRVTQVLLLVASMALAICYGTTGDSVRTTSDILWMSMPLVQVLIMSPVLFLLRRHTGQIIVRDGRSNSRDKSYTTTSLFLWTTWFAILASFFTNILSATDVTSIPSFVELKQFLWTTFLVAIWSIAIIFAANVVLAPSPTKRRMRGYVVAIICQVLSATLLAASYKLSLRDYTTEFVGFLISFHATSIIALGVLRSIGYRLTSVAATPTPSAKNCSGAGTRGLVCFALLSLLPAR